MCLKCLNAFLSRCICVLCSLRNFVINSGVYLLFFADSSEDTLMKLAGVLAIGLWFLWGPRMLVNYQANSAILCFLVYFQGERIEKGQGTWERRKEHRRNVTSPSGLFLFLFIAFLQEMNNLRKKQKLFKKWNTEDHRKCDGRTLSALWLILLLHCVFSRYGWNEIKTIGEIWHYLHGIFALFIVFFFFFRLQKRKK